MALKLESQKPFLGCQAERREAFTASYTLDPAGKCLQYQRDCTEVLQLGQRNAYQGMLCAFVNTNLDVTLPGRYLVSLASSVVAVSKWCVVSRPACCLSFLIRGGVQQNQ